MEKQSPPVRGGGSGILLFLLLVLALSGWGMALHLAYPDFYFNAYTAALENGEKLMVPLMATIKENLMLTIIAISSLLMSWWKQRQLQVAIDALSAIASRKRRRRKSKRAPPPEKVE